MEANTQQIREINKDFSARLPRVRGKYREAADLARTTWFRVGGPAEILFKPEDADDLALFLREVPNDIPVTVLGVGSNLLVRDGGIPGVVIRLGKGFAGIRVEGDLVHAGAGALDVQVAEIAKQHGLGGLEFLSGIPGSVGGALAMNAGAYGSDVAQILVEAEAAMPDGTLQIFSVEELEYGYRYCGLMDSVIARRSKADAAIQPEKSREELEYGYQYCGVMDSVIASEQRERGNPADRTTGLLRQPEGFLAMTPFIFTRATFRGMRENADIVAARMKKIAEDRSGSQPVRARTGGSTFKNPPPEMSGGRKAWQLIDAAGCRGLKLGGAQISELHCNFLINAEHATAADLENLGEEIRARVRAHSGVALEWEIKRIGEFS